MEDAQKQFNKEMIYSVWDETADSKSLLIQMYTTELNESIPNLQLKAILDSLFVSWVRFANMLIMIAA